jgi:hypothetical protein
MVTLLGWDRGGHSYFGSCSRWITSLEPHHGEAPIGRSSFSSQTRNASRQAHLEQPDRNLTDARHQALRQRSVSSRRIGRGTSGVENVRMTIVNRTPGANPRSEGTGGGLIRAPSTRSGPSTMVSVVGCGRRSWGVFPRFARRCPFRARGATMTRRGFGLRRRCAQVIWPCPHRPLSRMMLTGVAVTTNGRGHQFESADEANAPRWKWNPQGNAYEWWDGARYTARARWSGSSWSYLDFPPGQSESQPSLPVGIPRWLRVSAAVAILLGAALLWATGSIPDRPRLYPGSSTACVPYKGSPYIFDNLVMVGGLVLLPLVVVVWILSALIRSRGRTRVAMVAVGVALAFDAVLAFRYAGQLYAMRGGCS